MQVDHVDYDLSELRQVTAGNRIFFNKMVKTFISNASEDLLLMKQYLNKQEWKNVGELAHKMLPSYRHLHIVKLVKLLEDIEEICLSGKEHGSVAAMAEILHKKSLELFIALEKELK
jgi:HPt (histidine-containing phosphotransfer) domain-containing protein